MSPFDILLVGHLIGDYLFQTGWMAGNKAKKWSALITHSFVYTVSITITAWIGKVDLSIWAILIIFFGHAFLDRRSFVAWWVKTIMTAPPSQAVWLGIVVDQVFHILTIVLALYVSGLI